VALPPSWLCWTGSPTPAGSGSVIVAADFIIAPATHWFRGLLTKRLTRRSQPKGAGFAPTFPLHTWYRPLIAFDHALTRRNAAASTRIIGCAAPVAARPLATVDVPLDPAASEHPPGSTTASLLPIVATVSRSRGRDRCCT
jgi:hypothetical protein